MTEPGGRHVVLVVEDEPLLRMLAVDVVEAAGFEALEAADSTQAVGILEVRADIRVIFTDIDMPRGMNGVKLAAAVRRRWPPIGIIVTSGHQIPAFGDLPPHSVFFSKPYREDQVVEAMRRLAA